MKDLVSIKDRCIEEGDCWVWQGALSTQGIPVARFDGKTGPVRRIVGELIGLPLNGRVATCNCGNKLCVSPSHVIAITRKKLQARTGMALRGSVSSKLRSKKIFDTKLKTKPPKLSIEIAREVRSSLETERAAAKRLGVSQYTIHAIRHNKIYKDHGNPWLQIQAFSRA